MSDQSGCSCGIWKDNDGMVAGRIFVWPHLQPPGGQALFQSAVCPEDLTTAGAKQCDKCKDITVTQGDNPFS